ncbi:hypothetical protein RM550_36680 [Streptomyces sp. DSM 41527]|uniref:Uncharacterized protein n=1 Tax=Streptomyces mooreae TaxID=3075523 RepID=A0ABU2TJN6_9ACTN|nr:hypothetical protein [Streptomyces sp. DSM 41527]MDT0461178.1 hypothetical protein [Streptomyces sp. DSM 41527]
MTANHRIVFHILRRESAVVDARHLLGMDSLKAAMRQQHPFAQARPFADRAAALWPMLMETTP